MTSPSKFYFYPTVFLALLLLTASTAAAELKEGSKELTFNISFFHQQDSDTGSLSADGTFGYFLTDTWEVGARHAQTSNFVDDGSDTWFATTAPFLRYNFNSGENQKIVPYVGTFLGLVYNDEDVTGTAGPEGGMRFFVSENAFLNTQYRYEWFFNELELDSSSGDNLRGNSSDGNHVVTVGLGFGW